MTASAIDVWFDVASAVANRSHCVRSKVGAVVVGSDGRVLSTGYNGPPAGFRRVTSSCAGYCPRHDTDTGAPDFSDCPAGHAELNALLYSDRSLRVGGAMYITRDPCFACAKAIAASGLAQVAWRREQVAVTDREKQVTAYLTACGLSVWRHV